MFSLYTDSGQSVEAWARPVCTDPGREGQQESPFIPRFNPGWNKNCMIFIFGQIRGKMLDAQNSFSCMYVLCMKPSEKLEAGK